MASFDFTETHLSTLFARSGLALARDKVTLFGLRGVTAANGLGGDRAGFHRLDPVPVDYLHPRCAIGFLDPGKGYAVFPGSTVPHGSSVRSRIDNNGEGVNQLCFGLHRGYAKGMHKASSPITGHRALRMDSRLPIMRTGDDSDFDADDRLEYETPYDNLHCGWTATAQTPSYSSLGCQVIVGFPRPETGPWKRFVTAIYAMSQSRFDYGLFGASETSFTAAAAGASIPYALRYGSTDAASGGLVTRLQQALLDAGCMAAAPDGDFGFKTLLGVLAFQRRVFGKSGTDGVAGEQTGEALGIDPWPTL